MTPEQKAVKIAEEFIASGLTAAAARLSYNNLVGHCNGKTSSEHMSIVLMAYRIVFEGY